MARLFLDEIGDMPLTMQAKLLRVLEEGEDRAHRHYQADKRLTFESSSQHTATWKHKCSDGKFRQDLYHRVFVLPIILPPLRDRAEDIPSLIEHFSAQVCAQNGWKSVAFTENAVREQQYSWAGNVRELRNMVERLMLLASGSEVDGDTVRQVLTPAGAPAKADIGSGPLANRVGELRARGDTRGTETCQLPHDQRREGFGPGA